MHATIDHAASADAQAIAAAAAHVNIAAYKFVTFDNTEEMRPQYQEICKELGLKGTILLTPEALTCFCRARARRSTASWRGCAATCALQISRSRKAIQKSSRTSACW